MDDPRDEMNSVCEVAAEMATELLEKTGMVMPFALAILADGQLEMVAPDADKTGDDGAGAIEDVCSRLRSGAEEGRYRATAVVCDVRVKPHEGEETDAIRIEVEHASHTPFTCFFPYKHSDETYEHGQGYREPGRPMVFAS